METKLERIHEMSKNNPEFVFTSIGHMINKELLLECHHNADGAKAVGTDGISKSEYEVKLEENIKNLVSKLKSHAYHPLPSKRVMIPKEDGKMRPLGISSYEDKLVQEALKQVLEAVFEPMFYDCMYGFRPNRNCHMALKSLNQMIERNKTSYILDADILGFFNHIDHEWMVKFIGARIKDPNIIRLVKLFLKAGVMEDGNFVKTEEGTAQGSGCSPVMANIYMHYVVVWWFYEKFKPLARGYCDIVVYADDFVCCFQYQDDATLFHELLKKRLGHFNLQLQETKSRLIEFGRFAEENRKHRGVGKPETFDFLGFTHYCSHSRKGKFRVKRKTSAKKVRKKLKEINQWIKVHRNLPKKVIIDKLTARLKGYYRYYGITDNYYSIKEFGYLVEKALFHWLNKRSQKKSYNWERFNRMLKRYPLPKPAIYVNIYDIT
ncbi:MAG: group II intron reverse transcriptase/maturase [Anaerocolumna sp.]